MGQLEIPFLLHRKWMGGRCWTQKACPDGCAFHSSVVIMFSMIWDAVGATAVRRDAVLAGDLKVFRLLCNTNLNMIHN